MKWWWCPWSC